MGFVSALSTPFGTSFRAGRGAFVLQRRIDDENLDVEGERLFLDLPFLHKPDHRAVFAVYAGDGYGGRAIVGRAAPGGQRFPARGGGVRG